MDLLQRWFIRLSHKVERILLGIVILTLVITVASQVAMAFEVGRRFLSPVELLEGIPWPPNPGGSGASGN